MGRNRNVGCHRCRLKGQVTILRNGGCPQQTSGHSCQFVAQIGSPSTATPLRIMISPFFVVENKTTSRPESTTESWGHQSAFAFTVSSSGVSITGGTRKPMFFPTKMIVFGCHQKLFMMIGSDTWKAGKTITTDICQWMLAIWVSTCGQ